MLEQSQIQLGLQHLGIAQDEIAALQRHPTYELAVKALAALKEKAKVNFRKKALELHPDRNNGDVTKAELFKIVSQVNDEIQKLEMKPPVPVQQQTQTVFVQWRPGMGAVYSRWPVQPGVVFVKIRH